jgi:hypothetical protein
MGSTLYIYEMKKLLYLLGSLLFLCNCSNKELKKYQLPEITPSQTLVTELNNSRKLITDNDKSPKTTSFKIQFHGQSIVKGIKEKRIKETLEDAFTGTNFEIINTARSGLQVPQLLPLMVEDIYSQHADLLFFHAYGGTETGELKKYFENLKTHFTGDVIIFNHHLSYPEDKKHNKKLTDLEDKTSIEMEKLAVKYAFGFIDLRSEWHKFLDLNKQVAPQDLLRDGIHPNDDGKLLLEHILMTHLIAAIKTGEE